MKQLLVIILPFLLLSIDVFFKTYSKYFVYKLLPNVQIIPTVYNPGIFFSMYTSYSTQIRIILLLLFICLTLVLRQHMHIFAIQLIYIGILSNMLDRILFATVRDFLKVDFWFLSFVCNFADLYINFGIIIILSQDIHTIIKK
mgnify:CR=1 FL=1